MPYKFNQQIKSSTQNSNYYIGVNWTKLMQILKRNGIDWRE